LSRSTIAIYPYEKPLWRFLRSPPDWNQLGPKNADTLFSVQNEH
jgi:hypothetical protein